jgi:hypothetical protein
MSPRVTRLLVGLLLACSCERASAQFAAERDEHRAGQQLVDRSYSHNDSCITKFVVQASSRIAAAVATGPGLRPRQPLAAAAATAYASAAGSNSLTGPLAAFQA